MTDAVIVSTARTGLAKSWKGAFNMTHGATLGAHSVKHAVARARLEPATGPLPVRGASRRSDPWDGFDRCGGLNGLDTNQGLRTRAADAVEGFDLPDPARQRLAEMLDRDRTTESAQFVLAAGNPAYARAFDLWLRDPVSAAMSCTPEELAAWREVTGLRTALTLTGFRTSQNLRLTIASTVANATAGKATVRALYVTPGKANEVVPN